MSFPAKKSVGAYKQLTGQSSVATAREP